MTPNWHDNDNGMSEADLQAYVDGQLTGRQRAEIEAYLAANPAEAERLAAYRRQNIALHALFDPAPGREAQLSPELAEMVEQLQRELDGAAADSAAATAKPQRSWNFRRLAACLVIGLSAGAAGWMAVEQLAGRDAPLVALTRQASDGPAQLASKETPAAAETDEELQVVGWLAAQPGDTPQQLPDLEALGFELAAERVIQTASGQPAAQILYQDENGQRVTLYMRSGGKGDHTSFTFTQAGEAAQFIWQDGSMAYSLIGKMPQDQLLSIAEAINESLRSGAEADPDSAAAPAESPGRAEEAVAPEAGGNGESQPVDGGQRLEPLPQPMLEQIDLPKET
jgi:anti-sigma factor RsiW